MKNANNLMRLIMNVNREGFVKAKKDTEKKSADITVYGVISNEKWSDSDVTPYDVKRAIDEVGDVENINIYINSPGGDAFAGVAIANILKRTKSHTTAYVDGWAASAGSVILQGADERVVYPGSIVMIHKAWTIAIGDANDLMDAASTLETVDASLKDIYMERVIVEEKDVVDMMAAETWMTADEAVKMGFADKKEDGKSLSAENSGDGYTINGQTVSKEIYNNLPDEKIVKTEVKQGEQPEKPEPEPVNDEPDNNEAQEAMKAIEQKNKMQTLHLKGATK